ncbi:cyclic peptide export ABC transporter [Burkholderia sp. Se-20378]|uniref:cyclic peptide export ABC transporter n=1 Tax=Burkholderia sp. Se-20378 TaxID=2703899 RepID=UPI00197D6ABF|nr:cyclic peptide export ABC transporter [Burkholderia sp. Se-20378]MBN3772777.1 cyclic peptide export ABC transporter [Burkholderia sp. Se-20378]
MLLRRYLRTYRVALSATVLLSAASAGTTVAILAQINDLAAHTFVGPALGPLFYGIGWLIALLASSAASQYLSARLGAHLVSQLRTELSQQLIRMSYEKLIHRKHLVFGAFIEDIGQIAPLVLIVPLIAYNALLAIAGIAYLLILSIPLFGVLIAGLSVPLTLSWLLIWMTRSQFDVLRRSEEKVFEHLRAISEGKKEMSLNPMRAAHFTQALLQPAITRAQRQMTRVHLTMGLNQAWSSVMVYVSIFAVVYLGHGLLALPLSTVVPFVVGSFFLVGPLMFLLQVGQQAGTGLASLRHLEYLGLDLQSCLPPSATPASHASAMPLDWRHIRAEAICYRFPSDSEEISSGIGPISLDVRRGESIFIVGGNGGGKSTLLLLLCGLLRPSSGQLLIDGHAVHDDVHLYQRLFSGVFSDFFLFSHVLNAEGTCLPDERITEYLQQLELKAQVHARDGELSRLTLSTGQRKRLALLHCFAEDRDIVFFDEWAADQDPTFREHFYQVLLPELKAKGKTLFVISHDDRYFHLADRLIKLESGLVVADTRAPLDRHIAPSFAP